MRAARQRGIDRPVPILISSVSFNLFPYNHGIKGTFTVRVKNKGYLFDVFSFFEDNNNFISLEPSFETSGSNDQVRVDYT